MYRCYKRGSRSNPEKRKVNILINAAGGNVKEATTSDTLSFFDLPLKGIEKIGCSKSLWRCNITITGLRERDGRKS